MNNPSSLPESEPILWTGAPSQWQNLGWFFLCLLVLPIPLAFWKWLVTRNFRITLTAKRLRIREGVFSKRNEDVELYRVKDWTLKQPFHQRILRKGTVNVLSSDRTAPDLELRWMEQPGEFVEMLRKAVETVRDEKRVRELDMGLGDGVDLSLD